MRIARISGTASRRSGTRPRLVALAVLGMLAVSVTGGSPAVGSAATLTGSPAGGVAVPAALHAGLFRPPVRLLPVAPARFTHPGVLSDAAQLDFVRVRVQAGAQPWLAAYQQMIDSPPARLDRPARPRAVVACGAYSHPNLGCTDETQDALAAYTTALAWSITGDRRYADKAMSIMDAWSATITGHALLNAPLQAAWAGSVWARAGELIRYSDAGWSAGAVKQFSHMLHEVYLPEVVDGHPTSNGNWELSMMDATIGIAVFTDDRAAFDEAVAVARARVPAYIYQTSDGALPKAPPGGLVTGAGSLISFWHGQTRMVDGLTQETCRDLAHTGMGLAAIAHIAETARHQGVDLYREFGDRLADALELHARLQLDDDVPGWLCHGHLRHELGRTTEVAFNALHTRMGRDLPATQRLTLAQRPSWWNELFLGWETLTHADNPA